MSIKIKKFGTFEGVLTLRSLLLYFIYGNNYRTKPAGYSVNDIGKIDFSKLRNVTIGRIFSELNIIEQWGREFTNIIESCRQYKNIVPEFKEELL